MGLAAHTPEQEALLREIDGALGQPVWPLSLGRKAFVPGVPVRLPDTPPLGPGLRTGELREVLLRYPWPTDEKGRLKGKLRFMLDDPTAQSGIMRQDVPLAFDPLHRRYQTRFVTIAEWGPPMDSPGDTLPAHLAMR